MDSNRTCILTILTALLIVSLAGNIYFALQTPFAPVVEDGVLSSQPENLQSQKDGAQEDLSEGTLVEGSATLQGPAVIQRSEDTGGGPYTVSRTVTEGTMINLSVEIRQGKGRVLVETEPLMGVVFQDAAKTAVEVAENVTGTSLSGSDIIFSVEASEEIPAVDGPSAGALMTSLVLSVLNHQPLQQDVTLTGTIDSNGHIGAIGGVLEKAQAAEESGKSLILLPLENAQLVQYVQTTRRVGRFTFPQQTSMTIDAKEYIEQEIGIQVEYVETILQVGEYLRE